MSSKDLMPEKPEEKKMSKEELLVSYRNRPLTNKKIKKMKRTKQPKQKREKRKYGFLARMKKNYTVVVARRKKEETEKFFLTLIGASLQGFLFNLDGVVTTLLKSPFGQICFVINRSGLMAEEEKDWVIDGLTEINEQCKETLKKLGLLALVSKLGKLLEAV
ncbi:17458_t:CDS:2 [Racocetra fulgida]|uniref:17458_t:CDS:1 n=1 Tax=Racocetra fulgida TaxID=60492 RepID=A0A9N8Z6F4_9GLOM|nr:17458_t:CDS:2 [Racocetra fulgida]